MEIGQSVLRVTFHWSEFEFRASGTQLHFYIFLKIVPRHFGKKKCNKKNGTHQNLHPLRRPTGQRSCQIPQSVEGDRPQHEIKGKLLCSQGYESDCNQNTHGTENESVDYLWSYS